MRPLKKLLVDHGKIHPDCVSIFYRSIMEDERGNIVAFIIMIVSGTLFGGVHLIPSWFLNFASPQEMWLWRTSAIIITITPLLTGMSFILPYINAGDSVVPIIEKPLIFIWFLYPLARIILLILSLISLHLLSPAALQTIEWTTFIPHL
ncbi:hypothetical protein BDN70DRAFT_424244 [Pholiota conissans]|uniref:Uncharacterized protein n=1 Tax=Pholiota conissans TaxID=109636 RepID=A0A9P5YPD0_9AGAR|nr:hypothetical protein BDN70DRAFT_424244 [Pholiota conissans]